jgi:signal transduction histidine kinase
MLADKHRTLQVVENLLSNAIKFSPKNSGVTVAIERENENRAAEAHPCIVITVADEGPGLSDEDKTKLFGKFARLSAQPTGGEHSTGLGLSIVKKLVEAMRGDIRCESELGKGARFIVRLPADLAQ